MLAACMADLIKEGMLLAALTTTSASSTSTSSTVSQEQLQPRHPGQGHILQVYGWTPTLLDGFRNGRHDAFFLLLEQLDYTLSHKLEHWRRQRIANTHDIMMQQAAAAAAATAAPSSASSLKKWKKFWKKKHCNQEPLSSSTVLAVPNTTGTATRTAGTTTATTTTTAEDALLVHLHMDHLSFWKARVQLVVDLANAVEYLHSKRILHRDLKRTYRPCLF
jgi:hypothetical protein